MKLTPIKRRFLYARNLGKRFSYQDVCEKSWEVAPAPKPRRKRPAIFLEHQLDRITDTFMGFEREQARIAGDWQEYRPTVAYLLKSAYLIDGYLYKGAFKETLTTGKENLLALGSYENLNQGTLTSSYCSNLYFGHFIFDELPLTITAKKLGEAYSTYREPYKHEPEYRNLFDLHAIPLKRAIFKELNVIVDFPWNDDKAERFQAMRSNLREQFSPAGIFGAYFKRGSSGTSRELVNELEVENFLEQKGFVVIDPQHMTATEILEKSMGTSLVVGVEGSQLAPGLLTVKERGTILTLQPPNRFNNVNKDRADPLDLNYGFLIGYPKEGGFRIDIDELARTLDLIDQKVN